MIPLRVSLVSAAAAAALILVVLELIRSRRLQERYALLWLLTGGVMLMFAIWTDALTRLADMTGIAYPPSALFVLGSGFILVVLLHYSTVISRLSDQAWVAVEVILEDKQERELIPRLKRAGATGIITYPLNKVIP